MQKISVFTSGFNLIRNGFNFRDALWNFCQVGDEVVIAVNTSDDGTYEEVLKTASQNSRIKVIQTEFSYEDVTFDGAVKNAALQACSNEICVQMDLDERFNYEDSLYGEWHELAENLANHPDIDALLIYSIDLYGSLSTIRSDKKIGMKFRMQKKTGIKRGVVKHAWLDEARTKFNTDISDSTEPIYSDTEELVRCSMITHYAFGPAAANVKAIATLVPHTFHLGYVDFDKRLQVNNDIWAKHWELRSGKKENVATTKEELVTFNLMEHGIKLNF